MKGIYIHVRAKNEVDSLTVLVSDMTANGASCSLKSKLLILLGKHQNANIWIADK